MERTINVHKIHDSSERKSVGDGSEPSLLIQAALFKIRRINVFNYDFNFMDKAIRKKKKKIKYLGNESQRLNLAQKKQLQIVTKF